jgi:hypothetical protein
LFDAIISKEVLVNPDNGVQKRGYKILAKLAANGKLSLDAESLIGRLDEFSDGLSPAAKKVNAYDFHATWGVAHIVSNALYRIGYNCMRTCFPRFLLPLYTSSRR